MIQLQGVSYRYAGYRRPAIRDVDLRLEDGEIVGVTGPNDAGKSTLCLVVATLAPASIGGELTGDVRIHGVDAKGRRPYELAPHVGIVFANPAAQLSGVAATVFEEVAFGPIDGPGLAAEVRAVAQRGPDVRIECVIEGEIFELEAHGPTLPNGVAPGLPLRVKPLRPRVYPLAGA